MKRSLQLLIVILAAGAALLLSSCCMDFDDPKFRRPSSACFSSVTG